MLSHDLAKSTVDVIANNIQRNFSNSTQFDPDNENLKTVLKNQLNLATEVFVVRNHAHKIHDYIWRALNLFYSGESKSEDLIGALRRLSERIEQHRTSQEQTTNISARQAA